MMIPTKKTNSFRSIIPAVLLGFLLSLVLSEVGVRIFCHLPDYLEEMGYKDPFIHDLKKKWTGKLSIMDQEYFASTDRLRLRHTEHVASPPYDMKVLILGDSFAFGMGVNDEETFSSILERRLLDLGIHAKVINAAVPAYNLEDIECKYQKIKGDIDFDWVILTASFNDFSTSFVGCERIFGTGSQTFSPKHPKTFPFREKIYTFIRNQLLSRSKLALFLASRLNPLLIRLGIRATWNATLNPYSPNFYRGNPEVEQIKTVLGRLQQQFSSEHKKFIFLYIPGIVEANESVWQLALKSSRDLLDRDAPRKHVIQSAKMSGFNDIIDPLADPKNRLNLNDKYFPIDMHLNESGHRYFAELIAQNIIQLVKPNKVHSS